VVATASYQARRFGVGSAMATATAMRRCPHGVFLAPRMQAYREHSAAIMTVLSRFADVLEQVSIDEAYLQLHSPDLPADQLITEVAAAVWHATGLRVSVGAGHSKLLAKLASTSAKPRGLRVITSEQQQVFLDALPVSALPGIGPVAASRLTEMGIDTVAQLRAQPARLLQRLLGTAAGTAAIAMAQGRDTRPVGPSREAKTVSAERTMDYDVPASQLLPVLDTVLTAAPPQPTHRIWGSSTNRDGPPPRRPVHHHRPISISAPSLHQPRRAALGGTDRATGRNRGDGPGRRGRIRCRSTAARSRARRTLHLTATGPSSG